MIRTWSMNCSKIRAGKKTGFISVVFCSQHPTLLHLAWRQIHSHLKFEHTLDYFLLNATFYAYKKSILCAKEQFFSPYVWSQVLLTNFVEVVDSKSTWKYHKFVKYIACVISIQKFYICNVCGHFLPIQPFFFFYFLRQQTCMSISLYDTWTFYAKFCVSNQFQYIFGQSILQTALIFVYYFKFIFYSLHKFYAYFFFLTWNSSLEITLNKKYHTVNGPITLVSYFWME